MRLFWDTLSADIKRHEDRHVEIAKNYGRELEDALKATWPRRTCEEAAARADAISAAVLARHDRAQAAFDRVELVNFESRILRLMRSRLQRATAGGGLGAARPRGAAPVAFSPCGPSRPRHPRPGLLLPAPP